MTSAHSDSHSPVEAQGWAELRRGWMKRQDGDWTRRLMISVKGANAKIRGRHTCIVPGRGGGCAKHVSLPSYLRSSQSHHRSITRMGI